MHHTNHSDTKNVLDCDPRAAINLRSRNEPVSFLTTATTACQPSSLHEIVRRSRPACAPLGVSIVAGRGLRPPRPHAEPIALQECSGLEWIMIIRGCESPAMFIVGKNAVIFFLTTE